MNELIEKLEQFNFTKTEALVYLNLVKKGSRNGSQIAKDLSMSRSSVYSALDNMYSRGVVFLLQAESKTFKAENPEILFDRLKKSFVETADSIKKSMADLNREQDNTYYLNIKGRENFISKSKELLLSADKEVYINACIDLQLYKDEFQKINKKGVRILVFSFTNLNCDSLPVEYYYNSLHPSESDEVRMMLVVDRKTALIGSTMGDGEMIGTFTDNPLLVSIVSEHIHQDIYLLKLKNKFHKDLIDKDILLGTIQENQ